MSQHSKTSSRRENNTSRSVKSNQPHDTTTAENSSPVTTIVHQDSPTAGKKSNVNKGFYISLLFCFDKHKHAFSCSYKL